MLNPRGNFVDATAGTRLAFAIGPANSNEADDFDGTRPADDAARNFGVDPSDPAGAEPEFFRLKNKVFSGDAHVD